MRQFLLAIAAVAGITLAAGHWWLEPKPSFFTETLVILAATTVGLYHYLVRVQKNRPGLFVQFYIATIVLKILAYGIYMLITFRLDPAGATRNAVFFIVLYFIFTGLEVLFVYRRIGR